MSPLGYYMVRHSTSALYDFELVVVLVAWALVLWLWRRHGDARPLAAYLAGGVYDSVIELLAASSGTRSITQVSLFGVLPVGFPWLPLILGFFEGGVLTLAGFEITRGVLERDRRALVRAAWGIGALTLLISLGAATTRGMLDRDPAALTLTVRALFTPTSLAILTAYFAGALGWALVVKRADPHERRGLVVWYGAVLITAGLWYTPAFVSGVRRIGAYVDGALQPVGMVEQIAVLYGFSLLFEASGFYLPVYVVLRVLGVLRARAAG